MQSKTCSKCSTTKKLEFFSRERRGTHGRSSVCKQCKAEYLRSYREANKERLIEDKRRYREENREKIRQSKAVYNQENREKAIAGKHRRRARRQGLECDLTNEQAEELINRGCLLTGEKESVHLDHFIPLSWGIVGTTLGNMIPLNSRLNASKWNRNPFEWIKSRPDIDSERWRAAVEYLSEINGMEPEDFEAFVYECERNRKDESL